MSTRLYYGAPFYDAPELRKLTDRDLPPDGDYYSFEDFEVKGIRLTKDPSAWHPTLLLISVDVPLDSAALGRYRLHEDRAHEAYDLPEHVVNSSPRRWVRDEETTLELMRSRGEDRLGEECRSFYESLSEKEWHEIKRHELRRSESREEEE